MGDQMTPADSRWKCLYRAGGVAALLAALGIRRAMGAELSLLRELNVIRVGPAVPPDNVLSWFALLQSHPFMGLVWLDLLDLVEYAFVGLMFLALYVGLRRVASGTVLVALVSGLAGITVALASNQAFSMLVLSERYAAAAGGAERALLQAAGEALLAINNPGALHQGTGAYVTMFLVPLAGLMISLAMLRSPAFGRAPAYTGITANLLALGYFVVLALAPDLIWLPMTLSAPFRLAWYILIALRLFRLTKDRDQCI